MRHDTEITNRFRPARSRFDFRHPGIAAVFGIAVGVAGIFLMLSYASPHALIGVDIYNGQPYIDGAAAERGGATFIIAKASQGDWFTDFRYPGNRANTRNNGMIPGAYHFLERGDPKTQADFFVNDVEKGGSTKGVMFMLDVESYQDCSSGTCVTRWPSYYDVTTFVKEFQRLVPDRKLILYTGKWFWGSRSQTGYLGNPKAPAGTVLAVSIYVNGSGPLKSILQNVGPQGTSGDPYPGDPINGYSSYFIRQFTSSASFANENPVDGDVTYKSVSDLKALAGINVDTTDPSVKISSPVNNTSVKGTVRIIATASDNVGVSKVNIYLDGTLEKTDTTVNYAWNWDTTTSSPGKHTISVTAYDASGNTKSASITVNDLDQQQPTVIMTSPASGAYTYGPVLIRAKATDNSGISKVDLKVDNVTLATDTTVTYKTTWDSSEASCGIHTASATAYDKAGNVSTTTPLQFFADPPQDLRHDCVVDVIDLSIFLDNWAKTGTDIPGDLNNDGKVDLVDLSILLSKWGVIK